MNLRSDLFRGASASLAMRLISVALGYAVTVALARMLGPSGYGAYSFLLALITVLGLPAQFGVPVLMVREIGAARVREAWGLMRGLNIWAHRFAIVTSLPILGLALAATLLAPGMLAPEQRSGVFWGLALIVLLPLVAIRGGVLRGLQKVIVGQAPEQIVRPLAFLVLLAAPLLWGQTVETPGAAMAANVIATAVSWLVGAALLIGVWPAQARAAAPEYATRRWQGAILSMGLSSSMYLLDSLVGVLLLGMLASSADVGVYKAASLGAQFAAMGYVAVNTALAPRIAAAWARGDHAAVQGAVTRGARLSIAFCAPVSLAFVLIGEWGIELVIGKGFGAAYTPLLILSAGQLIIAAFGSATTLLNMTHNERVNTVSFGAGLGVNLLLTLALSPWLGATGAALAATASIAARTGLHWWFARQRLGMKTGFWARTPKG